MGEHINFLQDVIVKGKAPKEVTDAPIYLPSTSVSIALGISLQHLMDSLLCS